MDSAVQLVLQEHLADLALQQLVSGHQAGFGRSEVAYSSMPTQTAAGYIHCEAQIPLSAAVHRSCASHV